MLQLLILLAVIIVVFKLIFGKKDGAGQAGKVVELSDFKPDYSIPGTENLDLYHSEVKYISAGSSRQLMTTNLLEFIDDIAWATAGGAGSVLKVLKSNSGFYKNYVRGQEEEFIHACIVSAFANRIHALNISPEDKIFKDILNEYPKILSAIVEVNSKHLIEKDIGLLVKATELYSSQSYAEILKFLLENYIGTSSVNSYKSETHQIVNEIAEADLKWFEKDQLEITGELITSTS